MKVKIDKEKLKQTQEEKNREKKYTVLVVDDESANIESIAMLLEKEYNVIKASSGVEALSIIHDDPNPSRINLIITDQRMPEMMGIDLLKQIILIIPNTIRIVLTGYTDVKDIIDSINDGRVYKFLTKPIEPTELMLTIKRALESYELEIQNVKLIKQLKQINENLENMVAEKTSELQISLANLKKKNDDLEYLINFKEKLLKELQLISLTDSLTGLYNRRMLEKFMDTEWKRAMRTQNVISAIMIDIDNFKLYNDTYGHLMGDKCLITIAHIIKGALKRPSDLAVRYGGEEFCCILPETNLSGTIKIAVDILESIRKEHIAHENSIICPYVTVSLGVVAIIPNKNELWEDLLQGADNNLYKAKNNGKNTIWYENVEE